MFSFKREYFTVFGIGMTFLSTCEENNVLIFHIIFILNSERNTSFSLISQLASVAPGYHPISQDCEPMTHVSSYGIGTNPFQVSIQLDGSQV